MESDNSNHFENENLNQQKLAVRVDKIRSRHPNTNWHQSFLGCKSWLNKRRARCQSLAAKHHIRFLKRDMRANKGFQILGSDLLIIQWRLLKPWKGRLYVQTMSLRLARNLVVQVTFLGGWIGQTTSEMGNLIIDPQEWMKYTAVDSGYGPESGSHP